MSRALLPLTLCLLLAPTVGAGTPEAATAGEEVCVLDTSLGRMVFRFYPQRAPRSVEQVKSLVRAGFYDGKAFYRVVAGHVIQAGDVDGGSAPTVPGEFGVRHVTGAVGLARDEDPDSGSTEIYICLAPRPHLDGKYAVFGELVEGLDVLERIGGVEVVEQYDGDIAFHRPKVPVVIERAFLERRALPPADLDGAGGR